MKINIIVKLFCLLLVGGVVLTSCLEGDQMNTPPGASPTLVEMTYVAEGGTLFNSGLEGRFFAAQALLLSPTDEADTVTFAVTIQGAVSQDVTVSLKLEPERALDNLANDHVEYAMMANDQYKLLSTSAVIPQGKTYAEFQVVFYPPNIDFTKSIILPMTVTNDAGLTTSSNYGRLYFHVVGNPIAGVYTQQFIRVPDGGTSFTGRSVVFAPKDPTTISVPTGYYDGGPLQITFDNDGNGNLSNFKAVVDPTAVKTWTDAGIAITQDPTITVNDDYTMFTIHYKVVGGSGARDCTDIFVKD